MITVFIGCCDNVLLFILAVKQSLSNVSTMMRVKIFHPCGIKMHLQI